jgi:trypsin
LCDGCGASLIHADILLTAAHCNVNGVSADVLASAYQRGMAIDGAQAQARSIVKRVPHPNHNSQTQENDFMIMRLNEPVTGVTPIALNADAKIPAAGNVLTAIGFGRSTSGGARPNFLQKVNVPHVPYSNAASSTLGELTRPAQYVQDLTLGVRIRAMVTRADHL